MKVRVDRVVVRGLAHEPDRAELRERIADELRAALRPVDRAAPRDPAHAVAEAVARAAGGGRE